MDEKRNVLIEHGLISLQWISLQTMDCLKPSGPYQKEPDPHKGTHKSARYSH